MSLENFIKRIKDFNKLTAGQKIIYFVYYLTIEEGKPGVSSREIEECFMVLRAAKYSNIPSYLSLNSKRVKKRLPKFIQESGLFHLERSTKDQIDLLLGASADFVPSNNYFPLDIFSNTRSYLVSIATQASSCYDIGAFDACSVMTRKLLEVLIIEAFERYKISGNIKDVNGNFFFLSDLIERFKNESAWNIGRNAKQGLPSLKKMGDMSAHNRRFVAKKSEVDKIKDDLRIVLEELIHLVDYPSWK